MDVIVGFLIIISFILYIMSYAAYVSARDYIEFQRRRFIDSIRLRRSKQYIDLIKYDIRSVAQKDKVEGCSYFLIATVILIAVIICTLHLN